MRTAARRARLQEFKPNCPGKAYSIAVGDTAVILTPRGILRVAEAVNARNVMVDADFSAAQAADVFLRLMRARAVQRTRFPGIEPFDFETLMQVVP